MKVGEALLEMLDRTPPGATSVTSTPRGAHSIARTCVMACVAAFDDA